MVSDRQCAADDAITTFVVPAINPFGQRDVFRGELVESPRSRSAINTPTPTASSTTSTNTSTTTTINTNTPRRWTAQVVAPIAKYMFRSCTPTRTSRTCTTGTTTTPDSRCYVGSDRPGRWAR